MRPRNIRPVVRQKHTTDSERASVESGADLDGAIVMGWILLKNLLFQEPVFWWITPSPAERFHRALGIARMRSECYVSLFP